MKVGKFTKTNSKGQVVIPQEYRELFNITPDITLNIVPQNSGIYIQPVEKVIPTIAADDIYDHVLKETVGSWGVEKEEPMSTSETGNMELDASERRKQEW
jgi:bifunctional DNA-binding transcriptional regulator/antitoxin component of YhaV-PrlF toxin-antitoxin module